MGQSLALASWEAGSRAPPSPRCAQGEGPESLAAVSGAGGGLPSVPKRAADAQCRMTIVMRGGRRARLSSRVSFFAGEP